MDSSETFLLAALRSAPRRYRMPALPASAEQAWAGGPELALAFAVECARAGGPAAAAPAQALFVRALADLIAQALAPEGGDAAFQALVLRVQEPQVEDFVRLMAQATADRRAVRVSVDAIAHPGKLRELPEAGTRDGLAQVHGLALAGAWKQLRDTALELAQAQPAGHALHAALEAVAAHPALARLERAVTLTHLPSVQRYLCLCEQRGPLAGSRAAAAHGRQSARVGDAAEQATVAAFVRMTQLLDAHAGVAGAHRVLRSLRTPGGFPGEAAKAKEEWDAAIVRAGEAGGGAHILLLAEVKASAAAATPDFPRLLRGLGRLAQASSQLHYLFACAQGKVAVDGGSLRRLAPQGRMLPPYVIYCCTAPREAQVQPLAAAAKSVLLSEPACLAFARQLAAGASPATAQLAPIWDALTTAPRLRGALHQWQTSTAVREAMLHPEDLLQALAQMPGQ